MEIFKDIATVVGCISACIALLITIIKPLRQWVIDAFLDKTQHQKVLSNVKELDEKIDLLLENDEKTYKKIDKLEERLTRVEENVLENEADRLRSELFDCGNRCRRGIRLHPDEMDHVHAIFRKYSECLHQNGTGEKEYNFIVEYYNHQTFPAYHTQQNG